MISNIKRKLRSWCVNEHEEYLIAFGKFILEPSKYFVGFKRSKIGKFAISEGPFENEFGIDDIYISIDQFEFGWIQNIEIHKRDNVAKIGHFALHPNIGLGKRLAKSFATYLRAEFGVTKIHFIESSRKAVYKTFFEQKLGALPKDNMVKEGWLWEFGDSQ